MQKWGWIQKEKKCHLLLMHEMWNNVTSSLYNKRVRPTKNEPQQGISYLEREREGVW